MAVKVKICYNHLSVLWIAIRRCDGFIDCDRIQFRIATAHDIDVVDRVATDEFKVFVAQNIIGKWNGIVGTMRVAGRV